MIAAVLAVAAGGLTTVWAAVSIARSPKAFGPTTRIDRRAR